MPRTAASIPVLVLSCVAVFSAAEKLKPEELVARHVAAQVPAGGGRADRQLNVRGNCMVATPAKVAGQLGGTFEFSSSAQSSQLSMRFQSDQYVGETFTAKDGEVEIGFAQPRTTSRSAIGVFLGMNKIIVGEGLLGGILNARWPLAAAGWRQAKISYDGTKKFGGRDLHRLRYRAKNGQGQLDIFLYFEPDTYRHVGSVYSSSQAQSMGFTPETSSQKSETYFRLEETFADFGQVNGLSTPKTWIIRYERSGDTTTEWKYDLKVEDVKL